MKKYEVTKTYKYVIHAESTEDAEAFVELLNNSAINYCWLEEQLKIIKIDLNRLVYAGEGSRTQTRELD